MPASPASTPLPPLPALSVGAAGIALIRAFESCGKPCGAGTFLAYPDPATGGAPWTIGWGSTGPDIHAGLVWDQARCDARLADDLARLGARVANAIGTAPTTANQFDALVSFAYNLGIGHLRESRLLALHKAGRPTQAVREFAKWASAAGHVLPGLARRRAAEAALYARA